MQGVKVNDYPQMPFLWNIKNLYLGGHPDMDAIKGLATSGVTTIYNLRSSGEADYTDIISFAKEAGITYKHLPIMGPEGLDENVCFELNNEINDDSKVLVHCASANRVGGWLITYLVLEKKMEFEDAIELAMNNGLTNPGFIEQAQRVIGLKGES